MTSPRTYCKALLLLTVFSMNSVVSFACSLGGFFHTLHHQQSTSQIAASDSHHQHSATSHHQEEGMHHEHNSDGSGKKDNCCSDKMSEVEKGDKSVSRSIEAPKLVYLTSLIACFNSFHSTLEAIEQSVIPDLVRWRILATIPDLRIAIQSFQI